MLEFARWKYWLVAVVLAAAALLALPNVFGEDDALQLIRPGGVAMDSAAQRQIEDFLREQNIAFKGSYLDDGRLMVRFADVPAQLRARDAVNARFGREFNTALSFAPRAPDWLRRIGLRPMPLGLDLRGGLYLLYQVDVNGAVRQLLEVFEQDFRRELAAKNLAFTDIVIVRPPDAEVEDRVRISLAAGTDPTAVRDVILRLHPDVEVEIDSGAGGAVVEARMTAALIAQRRDFAIQQNLTVLRNRVNELGVSEPIVQRQGLDRIAVQLPGVQNAAEVNAILGKVATLEFRLVDTQNSAVEAAARGRAPLGSKLYLDTVTGGPLLLKRDVIVTGNQLTDATSITSQEGPAVSVKLDAAGGEEMLKVTRRNVGKPMAVVFIEQRKEIVEQGGRKVERIVKEEKVINYATIRGVFSNNFQITGLSVAEARELALLLRAGALAAPIFPIEERIVGPSLGADNIRAGVRALVVGMAALFVFMLVYYKVFGLVANLVLIANVVLLAALLTMFKAALSLPGIAGMVLTVGMAVDANVLIYERIREELRNGVTPQTAIARGFDKAFSAIADANITTLIAGIVLWVYGTGPIRGFAVVLSLGILTSMFTALLGARALLTLMYGGARRPARLAI
ncbi:MAG: protein translocase subunit SecD [Steroidobacteraceae bacterium]|nr:protein translocase subunit SecD [Steroidobacteraceae bacterium]MDW8260182.1 protein translocase subunit SecD [Gammaproteobacteria bacterium]